MILIPSLSLYPFLLFVSDHRNMRRGVPNLFKQGTSHLSGTEEAVVRNLRACKELAELTRTSLGPQGMNKMIINHLGMFIRLYCIT